MSHTQHSWTARFFDRVILTYAHLILFCLGIAVIFLAFQARHFALDASSETLMLENDQDLEYAREVSQRYGSNDFLVLTYTPTSDLLAPETLDHLGRLRDAIRNLPRVTSVDSLLDVPLLESPPVPIKELRTHMRYLTTPDLDMGLARQELQQSPLYQQLLISPDLKTTALLIRYQDNREYKKLRLQRNGMRYQAQQDLLNARGLAELEDITEAFHNAHKLARQQRHEDIVSLRKVIAPHRDHAELFLGGVSMIADDMITFIKTDLKIFGSGVLLLLVLTLGWIFRSRRWVVLPLLCCIISALCMMGLLGWFGWEVTVISSNFISLQLIITMAVAIHLVVRYRELQLAHPQADQRFLISETMALKLKPCLFATLTTIAGFASLLLCNILPVITFGWMMIAGLIVSLVITFLLFPTVLFLLPPSSTPPTRPAQGSSLTDTCARLTQKHGTAIVIIAILALVFSVQGITQLTIENSFIDYFKSSTEIYSGMQVIDRQLGGTTPLDVIVKFPIPPAPNEPLPPSGPVVSVTIEDETEESEDFEEFDEFDDFDAEFATVADPNKYWFTPEKMDLVRNIHGYLSQLPHVGKTLSLATTLEMAQRLNENRPLDGLSMAILFNEAPDDLQNILIKPYVSLEDNEVRFSMRIRDSEKGLRRAQLIQTIQHDLQHQIGLDPGQYRLAGVLILYNNMLQSLFNSQIKTLGITLLSLCLMFLLLFRSLKLALIALFPNLLAISVVLGFMGWIGIPLDMMTITIAAISVGIAVDDTIHYLHRFRDEFPKHRHYLRTMQHCHRSIGHAMAYTSATIMLGFSILALSNFIPSIYFGLLTSLAMLIALIAALTLLPQLIIMVKPFGPEAVKEK